MKLGHATPRPGEEQTVRETPVEVEGCDEADGPFELLSVLGEGGGGRVYLARERVLNRLVALKVVADSGAEAHTLAQLEHDHIVKVFSETVERPRHRRIICMQYVPGTTLLRLVGQLAKADREATGAAIVSAVDALTVAETPLEPARLAERRQLERADAIEATCLIGAALARALAHAHGRGVVHRDVKPSNILLTPYGRPMLVDFNIAASASSAIASPFGVTPHYAAPEHLLAVDDRLARKSLDARADLYSLAVVLFELIAGRLPYDAPPDDASLDTQCAARAGPMPGLAQPERSARILERVLGRCLAVEPARRYATAEELATALDACRALRAYERELPAAGVITRTADRHPIAALATAGVLPHLLGTAVNVAYNVSFPAGALSGPQMAAFATGTALYNAVAYPVALGLFGALLWRVTRGLRRLESPGAGAAEALAARSRVLALPAWAALIALLAWGLAIPFFAGFIALNAARLSGSTWGHLALSLSIAAVISSTYSALLLLHIGLRSILPWATIDAIDLGAPSAVGRLTRRLRALQLVASGGPPVAAVLLLALSPDPAAPALRALVIALMCAGVLGFTAATYLSGEATRSAEALERLRGTIARRHG